MKRSEMVDEIVCCLLAYAATYPQYPLAMLTKAAEEILKMQEAKGMLPPETKGLRLEAVNPFTVNEWEKE